MEVSIASYLPGDILFYAKLNNQDMIGTVISDWTGSEFVHAAIAISAMEKIEALGVGDPVGGIVRTPLDPSKVAGAFHYSQHAQPLDPLDLAAALRWLQSQVGSLYGWGDIANAFLAKFEHGFSIDVGEHYDCSALATEFLIKAGGINLGSLINPHEITPALLAQQLAVQPGQR